MKKKMKNKLQNNHGVTILYSLLLFLVVAMVSTVIIASAHNSSKRVIESKETTQNNLTVESAILMIKDDLSDKTYSYRGTRPSGNAKIFNTELEEISKIIINDTKTYDASFVIKSSNQNDVNVTANIEKNDSNYVVTFKLQCKDDSDVLSTAYEKFYVTNDTSRRQVNWIYFMSNSKEF